MICHAVNLFYEARGESLAGQRWVLDVVMNRVESPRWPDDVCGVITQRKQFSWYNTLDSVLPENILDWPEFIKNRHDNNLAEEAAMDHALASAEEHYYDRGVDHTFGADHYVTRNLYSTQGWWKSMEIVAVIDDHVFLKRKRR